MKVPFILTFQNQYNLFELIFREYTILLGFTLLHFANTAFLFFLYKLKVRGNAVSSKLMVQKD